MKTISVSVEQTNQAFMLAEWLENIRFVKKVDIEFEKYSGGNVEAVQSALDAIIAKQLFSKITDPVAYQRQLRDEWS